MSSSTEASPLATPQSVSRQSSMADDASPPANSSTLDARASNGSCAHLTGGLFPSSRRRRTTGALQPVLIEQPPPAHLIPAHTKEEEQEEQLRLQHQQRQQQKQQQQAEQQQQQQAAQRSNQINLPPPGWQSDSDEDDEDGDSEADMPATHSSLSAAAAAAAAAMAAVAMAASHEGGKELRSLRDAAVRIQSLYRGSSVRRVLIDPSVAMPQVNPFRRECWRVNKLRRRAIEAERSVAQIMPSACVQCVIGFLPFGEVARNITVTCREWLAAARMESKRQATLTMVTQPSLGRIEQSTLLGHIGALHTSLRICVSPLALNFDLFQSYFDLLPREVCTIAEKFPALTELVTCIKVDSVGTLVPMSPQGIHGHLYGGRTGQPMGASSRRLYPQPGGGMGVGSAAASQSSAPHELDEFRMVFPPLLKNAVLELGLPVPAATQTVLALASLRQLESLTLLAISELDLSPLRHILSLRSLSIRYSNLSGKTTRLRFPRKVQYAVLRELSQLTELEVEEGFLVEPLHPHAQLSSASGSFLHELLLAEEAAPLPLALQAPTSSNSGASNSGGIVAGKAAHSLRLRHLHMEKTTLVRGNEAALLTLPTLTTLTPFRFSYDCNFAFLRALPCLTQLHLHFSTSASPPPPMLPLMSHLLTCRSLVELSFRGVAFGASEQLLLLTFLSTVRLHKFRLMFCTLPSLRCIQTLAPHLRSLTLDSCVCLGHDPNHPGMHAPHVLFPYGDVVAFLQKMPRLTELYLNGTFEQLPYATLQLLTYPSQFFPALKKLVLTQGSVMLSSYDHRRTRAREEITLELDSPNATASDQDDADDGPRPLLKSSRHSRRHSARPGFNPPGLRR